MRACYLSTSALTVSSATGTTIPNLSFTATAGATYRVTYCGNVAVTGTTGDTLYIWLGGTATATMAAYHVIISTATTGASSASLALATLNPTTATATGGAPGATGTFGLVLYGIVTVNASGTLAVQAAKTTPGVGTGMAVSGTYLVERLV